MSANLASTLSLITGPALLTNASTVLLLGATNRLGIALDRQRRSTQASGRRTEDDPATTRRRLRAGRRVALLRSAMLLLQAAAGSFGLGTLIALIGLCVEQTISPGVDILADPAVLFAATLGGAALTIGVVTLFIESWLFGPTPSHPQIPSARSLTGFASRTTPAPAQSHQTSSRACSRNVARALIVRPDGKQFRDTLARSKERKSIS